MARTHARVKGKSGSSKPVNCDLSFVSLKSKEVKDLIIKLAKEDKTPSQIGLKLRDSYGVPSVKKLVGCSICDVLKEEKLLSEIPEDLNCLVLKAKNLKKHLELNSRDKFNKRGLNLIYAKIRRLSKYYKKTNRIAQNWRFD